MAKKTIDIADGKEYNYDDMIKILRSLKGSPSIIGSKDISEHCRIARIPTDIPTFDYLLSGGLSEGRITILAGNPSSGKSTSSLMAVAALQRYFKSKNQMKMILYQDPEGSFDEMYAKALGVDIDYVIIKRANKVIEDVFAEIDTLISTGFIGGLVIDSLDGLIARKVDDSNYGNSMGGAASAVSMHLPTLYSKIMEYNVTTILVKQARIKLGTYSGGGEIITYSGGKALRHFTDAALIVKRLSNKNLSYTPVQIKAEKTRSSRIGMVLEIPFGSCGIDIGRDLVNIAVMHSKIKTAGSWLTYDQYKFQGADRFVEAINNDKELYNILKEDVYTNIINVYSLIGESVGVLDVSEEE